MPVFSTTRQTAFGIAGWGVRPPRIGAFANKASAARSAGSPQPRRAIYSYGVGDLDPSRSVLDPASDNLAITQTGPRDFPNSTTGGEFLLSATGTWDSASIKVQFSLDGSIWVDSGMNLSSDGLDTGHLPGGSTKVRIDTATAGSSTNLEVRLDQFYVGTKQP